MAKSKKRRNPRRPKSKEREPERRGRPSEEEVIELAESRGNEPHLTAGDLAFAWGVSIPTIYKYSPRVIAHMTPWEKQEMLTLAEECEVSPSTFVCLLLQEYGKKLTNKIKKGGLRAVA